MLYLEKGPMTMPPSTLGAFAKSDPSQKSANLEWHVQPLSLDKFGEPLHPFNAITPSVLNLRPTSRGWIRAAKFRSIGVSKNFMQLFIYQRRFGYCSSRNENNS